MRRRSFIARTGAGLLLVGAGAFAWLRRGVSNDDLPAPVAPRRGIFPARYARTLRSLCARLVPDEPGRPGAGVTGAFEYIEREAAQDGMQHVRRVLLRGAVQLDRLTQLACKKNFGAASNAEQDEVIAAMLSGTGSTESFDANAFVQTAMGMTLEGMFCEPGLGGNKDQQGWKLVGYAMHPPRPAHGH